MVRSAPNDREDENGEGDGERMIAAASATAAESPPRRGPGREAGRELVADSRVALLLLRRREPDCKSLVLSVAGPPLLWRPVLFAMKLVTAAVASWTLRDAFAAAGDEPIERTEPKCGSSPGDVGGAESRPMLGDRSCLLESLSAADIGRGGSAKDNGATPGE